jgi:hypothetical protein
MLIYGFLEFLSHDACIVSFESAFENRGDKRDQRTVVILKEPGSNQARDGD